MSEIKAVNKSNSNLSVTMKDLTPQTYTYDAIGNRLSSEGVTGAWSYNANNELLSLDDVSYNYDDEGNMIQKTAGATVTDYIYDIENRLVRVEDGSGSVIAEYYYDPFGRRLWKDVDGSRTYYFYSDKGLIGEYDSGGNESKTYGYAPDSTWGTNPLFQKIGESYYWYINDHLGTPQMIIDTTGRTVWAATYDSFGKATMSTEEITNNLRFPGQHFDMETGLHYNWNRHFDSSIGRYISEDPIGFEGGINLYAYVQNNPVNWIDSTGRFPWITPPPEDPEDIVTSGCVKEARKSLISGKCPDDMFCYFCCQEGCGKVHYDVDVAICESLCEKVRENCGKKKK